MENKTVNGYFVETFIGKGGFGEVYRASKQGNTYAIKFIRKDYIYKDLQEERISREISALKRVDSPYTVKYFEDGIFIDNHTEYQYIVMELLEGKSLREIIGINTQNILEENYVKSLIKDVLVGLKAIHDNNIIHRDLKPENIFICNDKQVKILDYGLSKIVDYSSITQTGAIIGTFFYMSPEQVKGERKITFASDFYAVGVILNELLTGRILFYPSTDAEIVYKTINVKPVHPCTINNKISNNIENLILKLLEKDSYKRYRTAADIINEIDNPAYTKVSASVSDIKYYVRFIQNDTNVLKDFLNGGSPFDGGDLPINLHEQYKTLKNLLSSTKNIDFFSDPSTNRLPFSAFKNTKGLAALSYAPTGYDAIEPESFKDINFTKSFVSQVIELQVSNGCNKLTAPFFFFNDTNDKWYSANIKLTRESADYVKSKYSQYEILTGLCTYAETLCRKSERDKIIDDYANSSIDGIQFYVDRIYENTSEAHLFNFITTALSIKSFNPNIKIYACRVPAVAQGLLTIGFDGIFSGLGIIDSFSKEIIEKNEDDGSRMPTKFYFPDLLKSITMTATNKTHLDIISNEAVLHSNLPTLNFDLKCSCLGCNHTTFTDSFQKPRLHFLYKRTNEINLLRSIPADQRKDYFINRIDNAYEIQKEILKLGIKIDNPNYLLIWKEILRQF